ncbi:MAG: phosphomannose isomerase type II C-terminal cupin domain [Acidimicrobiales bacterium]
MSDLPERRPWGEFCVLSEEPDHKVKRLTVSAGCRLSYQTHAHRSEHWFIVSGVGTATIDGVDLDIAPGSCVDVPVGAAHRVTSTGPADLVLIEVQHGESFEEDDIVRLDDDYGRMAQVG